MIGIYKIISPSNKVYIGQSIDIDVRKSHYEKYPSMYKSQTKLNNSILKYGWKEHSFEVIEECSIELLNIRERYWQEYYDCINNGLNCLYTNTDNVKMMFSEETKAKMSKSQTGKKASDETKERMRQVRLGHILSDEIKEKISNAHKGKVFSQETLNKMSIAASKDKSKHKPVSCISPEGKYFEFDSILDAANYIGVSHQAICNVIHRYRSKKGICKKWSDFKLIAKQQEK
jgi:group I intron endonuclease